MSKFYNTRKTYQDGNISLMGSVRLYQYLNSKRNIGYNELYLIIDRAIYLLTVEQNKDILFNACALSLILNSFTKHKITFNKQWFYFIQIWQEEAIAQIEDFNFRSLSISIKSFGQLNIKPNKGFLKAWY